MSYQNPSDEPVVDEENTAEMPSDDIEIRDQSREAEEAADNGEWTEEELDAYNTTGEVRESFFDPRDDDPIEVSEGDTEPRAIRTTGNRQQHHHEGLHSASGAGPRVVSAHMRCKTPIWMRDPDAPAPDRPAGLRQGLPVRGDRPPGAKS